MKKTKIILPLAMGLILACGFYYGKARLDRLDQDNAEILEILDLNSKATYETANRSFTEANAVIKYKSCSKYCHKKSLLDKGFISTKDALNAGFEFHRSNLWYSREQLMRLDVDSYDVERLVEVLEAKKRFHDSCMEKCKGGIPSGVNLFSCD